MARRPNVGLGMSSLYSKTDAAPKKNNMVSPVRVGGYQFGEYDLDTARRRMNGDPVMPPKVKQVLGDAESN